MLVTVVRLNSWKCAWLSSGMLLCYMAKSWFCRVDESGRPTRVARQHDSIFDGLTASIPSKEWTEWVKLC